MIAISFTNGKVGIALSGTEFQILEPARDTDNPLIKVVTHGACYLSVSEAEELANQILNAIKEIKETNND